MSKSCKVELLQASQCSTTGTKIFSILAEYPRAIHTQLLTHRVFTKNSSSSRAVPVASAIQNIKDNPAKFIWTTNQSGMQGEVITDWDKLEKIEEALLTYKKATINFVALLGYKTSEGGLNVHKQNASRFLEPFQNIKVIITSTEWDNWDWLRDDPEAQGEIAELAAEMKRVRDEASPAILKPGQWHLPFVERIIGKNEVRYFVPREEPLVSLREVSLEYAIEYSMAMCAQVSYRKADGSEEKIETIKSRLFTGRKVHASPSEHQATPIGEVNNSVVDIAEWPVGVTHMDRYAELWSGNFKHWIQNRQLMPNHDKAKF